MSKVTPNRKLLIVDGLSGSGKTKVAKLLADRFNCPSIHGDPLMCKSVTVLKDEMENFFGERPTDNDGLSYLIRQFQVPTVEKERALTNIVRNNVEEQYQWIAENYDWVRENPDWAIENYGPYLDAFGGVINNAESDSDKLVFEWYTSNRFKRTWDDADVRIMLAPNFTKLSRFLIAKAQGQGIYAPENLPEIRRTAILPQIRNAHNVNYYIRNEYDDSLDCEVQTVYDSIVECKLI